MYLIDTNVISEHRKGRRANAGVTQFFATHPAKVFFLPVQVIGEIQAGIMKLRRRADGEAIERADVYQQWLESLTANFGAHVLRFDQESARVWGILLSSERRDAHTIDKQIAAIALVHDLIVVTGDKGGAFAHIPSLKVLNPFSAG
jgi:predicted nucleic acid-binding protein